MMPDHVPVPLAALTLWVWLMAVHAGPGTAGDTRMSAKWCQATVPCPQSSFTFPPAECGWLALLGRMPAVNNHAPGELCLRATSTPGGVHCPLSSPTPPPDVLPRLVDRLSGSR